MKEYKIGQALLVKHNLGYYTKYVRIICTDPLTTQHHNYSAYNFQETKETIKELFYSKSLEFLVNVYE